MDLIRLENYRLTSSSLKSGIGFSDFSLSKGDVVAIETDRFEDAHLFLRAIATLETPEEGRYLYEGAPLNLKNYKGLLDVKRKIGYIAHDAAVISNRSVRENLLFPRYYLEDRLDIELGPDVEDLCRLFHIHDKLEMRPSSLGPMEIQAVVLIRELAKIPDIILLDRPDDFISQTIYTPLFQIFGELISKGVAIVIFAFDTKLIEKYITKKAVIKNSWIETRINGR